MSLPETDEEIAAGIVLYAERIREATRVVIDRYRPALEALGHIDSCETCRTYADCQRHLASLSLDSNVKEPGHG